MESINGVIAGYDPGGNGHHGLALASVYDGVCEAISVHTLHAAEDVVAALEQLDDLIALGIDTLAAWSTGPSGWRAADLWLRKTYFEVRLSVVSPNGLYGSMGLNGMAVLNLVRQRNPGVHVTETHPKVLYWALTELKYDYAQYAARMDGHVSAWLGCALEIKNDHEWDAAVSAYAALCGVTGVWTHDLFKESMDGKSRLVFPVDPANYWWPS